MRGQHLRACVRHTSRISKHVQIGTIKSLRENEHLQYLRIMVCLKIASVVPDDSNDRKQEMWVIQASVSLSDEIAVFCSRNEWEQVKQSCEHAKECR